MRDSQVHIGGQPASEGVTRRALGLVLGEYSAGALWLVIDGLLRTTGHRVFT